MKSRFQTGILAALALALAAPAGAETGPPEAGGHHPLRIMALGDSLTKGTGSTHGAGYRLTFWHRMKDAGIDFDMVGSFHHGPMDIDRDHQGHQGQGVATLDDVTFNELRVEKPDVVLLLIGTNDAKEGRLVPEAFRIRYTVLLDRILAESHTKLIAATIPPVRYGRREKAQLQVNAIIREEVAKRAAAGKQVRLLDLYPMIDERNDFSDSLHMDDEGYAKIGNAFADTLLDMLHLPVAQKAP
jgi:lysophospholipase L1-like esterase